MRKLFENIRNFVWLLKPYKRYGKIYLIVSILLSLTISPLNTYASVFMQQTIIDHLDAGRNIAQIILVVLFFQLIIFVTDFGNDLWYRAYGQKKDTRIASRVNREVMEKVLYMDYKNFDNPEYFDAHTLAVREYASRADGAKGTLLTLLSTFLTLSALLSYLTINSPVVVLTSVLFMLVTLFFNTRINRINVERDSHIIPRDRRINYVEGIFRNKERIAELLTTRLSTYIFKLHGESTDKKATLIGKYNKKLLALLLINKLLYIALNAIVISYLVWQISNGQISLGSFVSMLTASIYLRMYLSAFFDSYRQVHEYAAYAAKIRNFFNLKSVIERAPTKAQLENTEVTDHLPYALEIRDLSFAYPNSNFALKNIGLSVGKGERIAIVGENGAGKTTLSKLLLRLYDPDSGVILCNGVDLRDLPIQKLRSNIGVAFQQSGIYALTFAENICLYQDAVDEETVGHIISDFEFDRIFDKTGADTNRTLTKEFDENGIVLSGGEMQKLALSRLFTKDFGLIILDEASSALDPIAEYDLNQKIFETSKNTTAIIIAHRLSSVRDADRIYVIDGGMIAESGNHDSLMAKKGLYFEMFSKQAEKYIE